MTILTPDPFTAERRVADVTQAERIADAVRAITGEPTRVVATSNGGPVVWVTIAGCPPRRLARVRDGEIYVRTRWALARTLTVAVPLAVEAIVHLDDPELDEEVDA